MTASLAVRRGFLLCHFSFDLVCDDAYCDGCCSDYPCLLGQGEHEQYAGAEPEQWNERVEGHSKAACIGHLLSQPKRTEVNDDVRGEQDKARDGCRLLKVKKNS